MKRIIEETASISEIPSEEWDKVLKEVPSLKSEDLAEKVRIRVYETVKVNITDRNAVVILRREDEDKQSLFVK